VPRLLGSEEIVLSYSRQMVICESVREMIKQALVKSNDWHITVKASLIPTTDSILRAASALPNLDTEEQLKDFIIDHVSVNLRLTEAEKEHLNLTSQK
jgi:hypothetical protein